MDGGALPRALAFGGDYNPEQWPEQTWSEDIALMRRAGVNVVTVGVFSWTLLEPAPGEFDFGWLDRVLDMLHAAGIGVDLATATATPPAWLIAAHPAVRPVAADGVRLEFGSRQGYCPSSPIFLEHAERLVQAMATRYGHHPAVRLWHISNEYGDHIAECFCDTSAEAFRRWLAGRYLSLDALNESWGTRHWGQLYRSWSEVPVPRRMPGPGNPGQALDWRRFCSDALLALMLAEKAVLRRISPSIPVTTNFMSMFGALDYWRWAGELDLITDDGYPDPADPDAHVDAARNYDLMRSLGRGRPWLLLEQAPSAVSWRDVNVPKRPGLMRLWSHQAIARGSDGAMFFQWRAPRYGSELHHSTMLPAAGPDTRIFAQTCELGAELRRLGEIVGSTVTADVAVIIDWDNWWALDAAESMPSTLMRWRAALRPFYRGLYERGVTVDFARAGDDLSRYRLVVVPNAYLLRSADAERLSSYVATGGHLVVGPFSGVVDERCHAHPGGAPGPLADLLGVRVQELWPLPDGVLSSVTAVAGSPITARIWTEWLTVTDAEVLARYADGELAGLPAVTRRRHGRGTAHYVSLLADDLGVVLDEMVRAAGIATDHSPGVERLLRRSGDTGYLYLLNHSRSSATIRPGVTGTDLISGDDVPSEMTLAADAVAVVRHRIPVDGRGRPPGTAPDRARSPATHLTRTDPTHAEDPR